MDNSKRTQHEMYDLIARFLRHETTVEEIRIIEKWLAADPSNRVLFKEINTEFQALSEGNQEYDSVEDAWSVLSQKIEGTQPKKEIRTISISPGVLFMKIAASVTIIMIAAFVAVKYFSVSNDEQLVYTNETKNTKQQITLSDGTRVWLNVNSSIQYGDNFGKETRTVLLKGEAFFDVTKTGTDFIVQTSNFNIQVKGTRFNVTAFNDDKKECATLEEGRIVLKVKGSDEAFDMKPGDQVTYDQHLNEVSRKVVHASNFSLWKEDELKFRNASLEEILKNIETRYQVRISVRHTIAKRENLSMTIQNETLEEVLELISISTSLKYQIYGSEVVMYE